MGTPIHQAALLASAQGHESCEWLPLLERAWRDDPYRGGRFHFTSLEPDQVTASDAGHFGVALSARGQLKSRRAHHLYRDRDERRGLLEVEWSPEPQAQPLTVYCAHLSVYPEERLRQVDELIEIMARSSGPAILIGDLNDDPDSECLRRLTQPRAGTSWRDLASDLISDSASSSEPPLTFSVKAPERRIDYILGRDVECIAAGVASDVRSSDHFPIWADLSWVGGRSSRPSA